ncbi:haloacid dehalogenase type II [uncultured Methylibium sp.]|uniref:haloacid dehalogenase type II n=1 Tax=uncultured Methylibium sp. TaxID=381093 RepID=UPI0025F407B8|nr:haloacid dehalogenase type II [uncultured Methylibium sp.]
MQNPALDEIRALVFDVFGTVVDWHGGILRDGRRLSAARGLDVDWHAFALAWREGYAPALERVRRGSIAWANLDRLHRTILDELLPRFGLEGLPETDLKHLNRVWHRLDPWPDTRPGLRRLKAGRVISTLSNGHVALLVDMARHGDLPWDCILSAELFGTYKPELLVYRRAAALLGLAPEQVMMVAAHPSDLAAAREAGLRTAYVPRPAERGEPQAFTPAPSADFDLTASDFEDLARQFGL